MSSTNSTPIIYKRNAVRFLSLLSILAWLPVSAGNVNLPIKLQADSILLDQRTGNGTYLGNMRLRQGSMSITANKAITKGKQRKPERITVFGNPLRIQDTIEGETVKLNARKAFYNVRTGIVELSGSVSIYRNNETLHSSWVRYDLNQKNIIAEDRQKKEKRVRATILPTSKTVEVKPDNITAP